MVRVMSGDPEFEGIPARGVVLVEGMSDKASEVRERRSSNEWCISPVGQH